MAKDYIKPDIPPSHAGHILRTGFIEQHGLRIDTVASIMGIARGHLSRILNGRSPITPDIALKLEMMTHTPAGQWLAMQAKYDAYRLAQNQRFTDYKKMVSQWVAECLPLPPKERRSDANTQHLVAEAARLAKQINTRRNSM